MPRRRKLVLTVFVLLVLLSAGWVATGYVYLRAFEGNVDQLAPIVISEVSAAGNDWVRLKNTSEEKYDLSGFILTDGDNFWPLPHDA